MPLDAGGGGYGLVGTFLSGEVASKTSDCDCDAGEVLCLKIKNRVIRRNAETRALREDHNIVKVLGTRS